MLIFGGQNWLAKISSDFIVVFLLIGGQQRQKPAFSLTSVHDGTIWRSLTKRAESGTGSVSQRCGSGAGFQNVTVQNTVNANQALSLLPLFCRPAGRLSWASDHRRKYPTTSWCHMLKILTVSLVTFWIFRYSSFVKVLSFYENTHSADPYLLVR